MPSLPKIVVQWQQFDELTPPALYELLRFRQEIFVVEQRSPYPDLDGLDRPASHLSLRVGDALAGYLRLLPPKDAASAVRIGRVAVTADLRGHGLGRVLMTEALSLCRERYAERPITLSAQLHLAPFYRGLGFSTISEPYEEFGIAHIDMRMPR